MDGDELAYAGVRRQAELIRSGAVSARELIALCLDRIERLDPALNAFRVVFAERALAEAQRPGDGPLAGVPVAVKDDVDVAGELTTHGTAAVTRPAAADSELVARLRAAGAIVIGKTTLPELAQWGTFTESTTFGVTRNPWDRGRSPGGSSGGSAAAVAAGLVGGATGSDGGASVRVPAAWCGLFGLKPQRGRIPGGDRWHGLLMNGTLTRSVVDGALLLDVLARGEGRYAAAAQREPGRLRIAYSLAPPVPWARVSGDVRAAVLRTAERLSELGHDVDERDPVYPPIAPLAVPRMMRGVHDEAAALDRPDLLERRTRTLARAGGLFPRRHIAWLRRREPAAAARLNGLFGKPGFHALLLPTTIGPPPPVEQWKGRGAIRTYAESTTHFAFCPPWNLTGQPAASVPAGFTASGLPIGVQLVTPRDDEETILSLAAQLERAHGWTDRRPPGA